MKAARKKEILAYTLAAIVVVTAVWTNIHMWKTNFTETVTGTVIAKSDDVVKSGKYSTRSRLLLAVKLEGQRDDTIELPLHDYVKWNVGDRISYEKRYREDNGLIFIPWLLLTILALGLPFVGLVLEFMKWLGQDS